MYLELSCCLSSAYLVDDSVPGKSGIVDDDVDFAVSELCGLLY